MVKFGMHYDWYSWCYKEFGACFAQVFPLLLPVALSPFTPMAATHETTHSELIRYFTAGFL